MRQYDIMIVGVGPAGSTVARLLNEGFSVAVIDKKAPDSAFQKPCGGLLAPDAQKIMASLGWNLPKAVLVDPQIFAVETIDLDSGLRRFYQRFYLNLDRDKFDRWMMEEIPPRVERIWGSCVFVAREAEGYRLRVRKTDGSAEEISAKILIGADGAHSIVRRTFYPKKKLRRYVAVQQWFEQENAQPLYRCFFDSETTDCYSWSVAKDGKILFGGAFPPKNARAAFERQKEKFSALGCTMPRPLKTEACEVLRPRGLRSFCCGEGTMFLVGEAAGFISPSSLEGISSALLSGAVLAQTLNEGSGSAAKKYRRRTRNLRLRLALKNAKCPALYWPILRRIMMASGIASIELRGEARRSFLKK